jgi:BlaI family transcriptional regulator, penicillinase repressor
MGKDSFSDRELDIMSLVWRAGSGTVTEVRECLSDDLAYTSVLKIMQILEEKGALRHEPEGRAYRYFPVATSQEAGDKAINRILDKIFHGSAELLLARLVSDPDLSKEEIQRMKTLLDQAAERDVS